MSDLIWIGNTLYPRWIVFAAIAAIPVAILITGIVIEFVHLVRELRKPWRK